MPDTFWRNLYPAAGDTGNRPVAPTNTDAGFDPAPDRRSLLTPPFHTSKMSQVLPANAGLSAWNFSRGKRIFDCVASGLGLLLVFPVMTVIAIAIKSTSKGPALFRQQRIGKDGQPFEILKFRTMRDGKELSDLTITREGDSRITPLGKVLRKSKLDELPQLFNVMVGDMSLVGPRPDIAEYCETLPAETRSVLKLRPGLTGWSTLQYRDEERLLAKVPEEHLAHYYLDVVFPEKARLALEYARHATFSRDLKILLRTLIGT